MHKARMREEWNRTAAVLAMIHNCAFGVREAVSPSDFNPYAEQRKKVYVSGEFVRELFQNKK